MSATCNDIKCTCPHTSCERHGKCCECVNYHRTIDKSLTVCLRPLVKQDAKK